MKKLYVRSVGVVGLVVVLSLLISGVALAGGGWNKWQPIEHDVVSGTFKFADDTVILVKEYTIPGFVGDFVVYLTPFDDIQEFDNEVYYTECVPQGATLRDNWAAGHWEDLTGRDLGDLGFDRADRLYSCRYPAGWHDAQP